MANIADDLENDDTVSWFTPITNMEISAKCKQITTLLFHAVNERQLYKVEATNGLHGIVSDVPFYAS